MSYHRPPFLHRVLHDQMQSSISEGWVYSSQEAEVYGGFTDHWAIDFAIPSGTPILAAADGLALASFLEKRIRYPEQEERSWHGEPVFWGYGLFVIIQHANGLYTTYAHLRELVPVLKKRGVYVQPTLHENGDITTSLLPVTESTFARAHRPVPVKAGRVIGYSGITGMGMGQPTYDNWLHDKPYRVSDEEHVHFELSTAPGSPAQKSYIDPFNIYGHVHEYPAYNADWSQVEGSLWLE